MEENDNYNILLIRTPDGGVAPPCQSPGGFVVKPMPVNETFVDPKGNYYIEDFLVELLVD